MKRPGSTPGAPARERGRDSHLPFIVVKPPGGKPYRKELLEQAVTIGRSSSNEVTIKDDPKVSRQHCRVEPAGEFWAIVDLGTSNGTKLNGEKLAGGPKVLESGDEVRVGATAIIFEDPLHKRRSAAQKLMGSISNTWKRIATGGGAKTAPKEAALGPGRMKCASCGAVLNTTGKKPGDKIGCPRCRAVHNVPR